MRLTLVFLVRLGFVLADFDIDDSILYKIDFPGYKQKTGLENVDEVTSEAGGDQDLFTDDFETYTMVSRNNEKFECMIPRVKGSSSRKDSDYTGLTPVGLMEKMMVQQSCAYRVESYWTYELCHGRYLRQYHEERDGKEIKVQEYFLGKYSKERFDEMLAQEKKDMENDITRHPPTKKIESMSMPYFELVMEDGTLCDLNNQPRRARVLYVCYPTGRNEVYQLKETSTCEYEVIVLTSVLCEHPAYKPAETSQHDITCRPVNPTSGPKPADLLALEVEGVKLRNERMWEAHMRGGDKPGQVKIEIRPADPHSTVLEDEEIEQLIKLTNKAKEDSVAWKGTNREPFKPLMDPQVVKEFLRGEYCLYGGSGWWKYEFCYGKKVDQYHQDEQKKRTVINLGKFDEAAHLQWIKDHPNKRPKPVESRKHVSHFYSSGDICDLTQAPRHLEVKLKCKKADSPSAVTLYLLEPKPCEYVLGVESPLVCDILPHADPMTGLMPQGIMEFLEEKPVPEALEKIAESLENSPLGATVTEEQGDLLFSTEERERLVELKRRLRQKQEQAGTTHSLRTVKKETSTSSSSSDGSSSSVKETVHIVNGVKTTVREKMVDGVVVEVSSSEQIEEDETTEPKDEL